VTPRPRGLGLLGPLAAGTAVCLLAVVGVGPAHADTPTPAPGATTTLSPTPSPTASSTPTLSPSPSPSPDASPSPSSSGPSTAPSGSASPTASGSLSPSGSPHPSGSPSPSASASRRAGTAVVAPRGPQRQRDATNIAASTGFFAGLPPAALTPRFRQAAALAALAEVQLGHASDAYLTARVAAAATAATLTGLGRRLTAEQVELVQQRRLVDQFAAQMYMDPWQGTQEMLGLISPGSAADAQARLDTLTQLGGVQASAEASTTAVVASLLVDRAHAAQLGALAHRQEAALGARLRTLQALTAQAGTATAAAFTLLGPAALAESSAAFGAWDTRGTASWSGYVAALKAARITPPSAALLNDPAAWPRSWHTLVGADGRVEPGVAVVGTPTGPLTLLPAQTITAVSVALSRRGVPYLWGGTGRGGYDCSGLTSTSYDAAGLAIPRTADVQWSVVAPVPLVDALPGDLLFFYNPAAGVHHVGIYLGGGLMLDAPHTGAVVRIEPVFGDVFAAGRPSLPDRAAAAIPAPQAVASPTPTPAG